MYNFSAALHVSGQGNKYCWTEKEVLVLLLSVYRGTFSSGYPGSSSPFSFLFFWNMYCTLDHMCRKKHSLLFFFFAFETQGKNGKDCNAKQKKKVFISQVFTLATLECAQYTLAALILLLLFRVIFRGRSFKKYFSQSDMASSTTSIGPRGGWVGHTLSL